MHPELTIVTWLAIHLAGVARQRLCFVNHNEGTTVQLVPVGEFRATIPSQWMCLLFGIFLHW